MAVDQGFTSGGKSMAPAKLSRVDLPQPTSANQRDNFAGATQSEDTVECADLLIVAYVVFNDIFEVRPAPSSGFPVCELRAQACEVFAGRATSLAP